MKIDAPIQSDVQAQENTQLLAISWVGMGQIQSACSIADYNVPCSLDIGVNLKAGYRGIHMSRLYQAHLDYFLQKSLDSRTLIEFLQNALNSQEKLSDEITVKVSLQFPMVTQSLKSGRSGFRNYPISIIVHQKSQTKADIWVQFEVLYSSTCPQSASLSMEMLNSLDQLPSRLPGTPHAQRSRAVVKIRLPNFTQADLQDCIRLVENSLQTPVQTVVKKVDEMEFARLNAENLMFCEDAVRNVYQGLSSLSQIKGFSIFCEHQESLHPHNASSYLAQNWLEPKNLQF